MESVRVFEPMDNIVVKIWVAFLSRVPVIPAVIWLALVCFL